MPNDCPYCGKRHFNFWGDDNGDTPRYGATMSRDGETWECGYDCMFGAGFDDIH